MRIQLEADIGQRFLAFSVKNCHLVQIQEWSLFCDFFLINGKIHLFAYHHFDKTGNVDFACIYRSDGFSLSKNCHSIRDLHHFIEFMSDDHNRASLIFHIADNAEQLLDFLRSQNCGRLVHDQDLRATIQNLYDLQRLLFPNGHIIYLLVRVDIQSVLI